MGEEGRPEEKGYKKRDGQSSRLKFQISKPSVKLKTD
jgi:hypothetical protein